MNSLSIIFVIYGEKSLFRQTIQSLSKSEGFKYHEIILIENGATGDMSDLADAVEILAPSNLVLIRNSDNFGFARAVNQGIERTQGDIILLLNPDTAYYEGFLGSVIDEFSDLSIAALGCKILNFNKTIQESCGNFPTIKNLIWDRMVKIFNLPSEKSYLIRSKSYYENRQRPDWISGAAMFISKKAIKKIGKFSDSFFMYNEDMEWCFRARKNGYKIVYNPLLSFIHRDSTEIPEKRWNKFFWMHQGMIIFFKLWRSSFSLVLLKIIIAIYITLLRIFFYLRTERSKYKLGSYSKILKYIFGGGEIKAR